MYKIIEVFLDESNHYRVRAIINKETQETKFFKFDHYPTQNEIDIIIDNYLAQYNLINNEGV